jgi:hypothetical protein
LQLRKNQIHVIASDSQLNNRGEDRQAKRRVGGKSVEDVGKARICEREKNKAAKSVSRCRSLLLIFSIGISLRSCVSSSLAFFSPVTKINISLEVVHLELDGGLLGRLRNDGLQDILDNSLVSVDNGDGDQQVESRLKLYINIKE